MAQLANHTIFQWRHKLLNHELFSAQELEDAKDKLMNLFEEHAMTPLYLETCKLLDWVPDKELTWVSRNTETIAELDKALADAKEQYGDVEVKDARLNRAHHLCRIGDWPLAMSEYEKTMTEKAIEGGGKLDILLTFLRIGLFTNDLDLTKTSLERAEKQSVEGCDWERLNRLRIYKAIHLAMNERKLTEAAELLISGLSTFTATELMTFTHFVQITVLLAMCSLPRPTLKAKVMNAAEVHQIFGEDLVLAGFFNSFMKCDYRTLFANFSQAVYKVRSDQFLSRHYRSFVRNMRLIAYRQYLEPYKSVTLEVMSNSFGLPAPFIEEEIVSFITAGKLNCKIDRVANTIESKSSDTRNNLYLETVKKGDALINQIQMLSRIIDL